MTAARTRSKTQTKTPDAPPPSGAPDAPPLLASSAAFDATSLLASATIVERKESNHRDSVDVPPEVVAFAQNLYDTSKAAKFPVTDAKAFAEQKLMWQSAGDKTTPPTSATITELREPATGDDGKPLYHQMENADGELLYTDGTRNDTLNAFNADGTAEDTEPVWDTNNPVMNLVGLRVSFGKRRGQKNGTNTNSAADSPSDAADGQSAEPA